MKQSQEIRFPVDWEFRIIVEAEKAEAAKPRIVDCLERREIVPAIHEGLGSSGGRYTSFKVPVLLTGREMMNRLAAELAAIDGVKFVL